MAGQTLASLHALSHYFWMKDVASVFHSLISPPNEKPTKPDNLMTDNPILSRMRTIDVPTFLSLPSVLALPTEVQERFANRIEAVLDGLESRESYVRDVRIKLNGDNTPLITAQLGGFGDVLQVTVFGRAQEPGLDTLEYAFHRTIKGERMVHTARTPHQLFEDKLKGLLG